MSDNLKKEIIKHKVKHYINVINEGMLSKEASDIAEEILDEVKEIKSLNVSEKINVFKKIAIQIEIENIPDEDDEWDDKLIKEGTIEYFKKCTDLINKKLNG